MVGEFSLILPVDRIDFQSSPDNGILLVSNVVVRKGKGHFHVNPPFPPAISLALSPVAHLFHLPFLVFSCFRFILFYVIRSVRKRYPDQSSRSEKRSGRMFLWDFAEFGRKLGPPKKYAATNGTAMKNNFSRWSDSRRAKTDDEETNCRAILLLRGKKLIFDRSEFLSLTNYTAELRIFESHGSYE